jgi:hypothetical protein
MDLYYDDLNINSSHVVFIDNKTEITCQVFYDKRIINEKDFYFFYLVNLFRIFRHGAGFAGFAG